MNGNPQQVWPPGTSLLYATVSRITQTPTLSLVRWVNTLAFLLLALGCVGVANLAAMRTPIAWAMLAAVLCNGVIISMQNKLWSEPPTLALLSLLLFVVTAAVVRPEKATVLLGAAIMLAAAAILFRYAMLPTIGLIMAIAVLQRRWWIALAAPLAVAPMVLVLAMLGASRGERDVVARTPPGLRTTKRFSNWQIRSFRRGSGSSPPRCSSSAASSCRPSWNVPAPRSSPRSGHSATQPFSLSRRHSHIRRSISRRACSPRSISGAVVATAAACETAARRHSRLAIPLAAALLIAAARALRFTATNIP